MGTVTIDQLVKEEMGKRIKKFASKGGKARAKKLTAKRRSEIARKAGKAGGRGRGKNK